MARLRNKRLHSSNPWLNLLWQTFQRLPLPLPVKGLILGGLLVISLFYAEPWKSQEGRVIEVADGDTLTLVQAGKKVKVRLAEIDAPEKEQPFGQKARDSLEELVEGKVIEVRSSTKDRYGRIVGRVYVEGQDINAEQLRRGLAWFYESYGKDSQLRALAAEAKAEKRGLWSQRQPTPPWEWRQEQREN